MRKALAITRIRLATGWRGLLCAALCLMLFMVTLPAMARDDDKNHQRGRELDEAVRSVKHRTRGQILSAKTHQDRQRRYHKIRVLTPDGRVKNVRLPANGNTPRNQPPRDRKTDDEWQP